MPSSVINNTLATWDVYDLNGDDYTIRLTVTLQDHSQTQSLVYVKVKDSAIIKIPNDFSDIQTAINAAHDGITILVAPGTYTGSINFSGKAIHLKNADKLNRSCQRLTVKLLLIPVKIEILSLMVL